MSSSSRGAYARTVAPRCGSTTTRPSASRRRSASRTGVRLTSRRWASSSSLRRSPAAYSPSRIASRIRSEASWLDLTARAERRGLTPCILHIVYDFSPCLGSPPPPPPSTFHPRLSAPLTVATEYYEREIEEI